MDTKADIHVAVGVIENSTGEILISKRQARQQHAGLWEFPGGKICAKETVTQALARELKEELGIKIHDQRRLIQIKHRYQAYSVFLDVYKVTDWSGNATGREGQEILWLSKHSLQTKSFLEANLSIIRAIQLSEVYFITPEPAEYEKVVFSDRVLSIIESGVELIQFRTKQQLTGKNQQILQSIANSCRVNNCKLVINTTAKDPILNLADGLHLSSQNVSSYTERPIEKQKLLSISCHNQPEVIQANTLDADVILIGPVKKTDSHPTTPGIGWDRFRHLCAIAKMPAYALGGMNKQDLATAWQQGGQGVAMISGLWNADEE